MLRYDAAARTLKQTGHLELIQRGAGQYAEAILDVKASVGIEPKDFLKSLLEAGAAGLRAELPPGQIHSFRELMMPADDWGPALAVHRAEQYPLQIPEARKPLTAHSDAELIVMVCERGLGWKLAFELFCNLLRCPVQITGTCVVTKSCPVMKYFVRVRCSQCL